MSPGVLSGDIGVVPDLVLHRLPSEIQARGTFPPLIPTPPLLNTLPGTVISYP